MTKGESVSNARTATAAEYQSQSAGGASQLISRDATTTRASMECWLERKLGSPVRVDGLQRPSGAGTSNDTQLFSAHWHHEGVPKQLDLVLRVQPASYQLFLDPLFHEQYRLLEILYDSSLVRVAKPFWYEHDTSVLGQPFYVMARLPGRVPVSFPPYNQAGFLFDASVHERRKLWVSAVGELARIHRTPLENVAFLQRPAYGVSGFEQHWNYQLAYANWATSGRLPVFMERTLEWLVAHRPANPLDGFSWGDARIGNMMFSPSFTVAGVMDWEQMSLGGAMQDLGWWTFFDDAYSSGVGLERLAGLGSRDETVALWEALTGLECHDLLWYEVFAGWKLAIILCRKFAIEGTAAPGRNSSNNLFTRLIAERLEIAPPRDECT